jgi:hypothetical protein
LLRTSNLLKCWNISNYTTFQAQSFYLSVSFLHSSLKHMLHTKIFVLIHYTKNRMHYFQMGCNADTYLATKIFWQSASLQIVRYPMQIWGKICGLYFLKYGKFVFNSTTY